MTFMPLVFFGLVTALLARRKGYNPLCWFFAGAWFLWGTIIGLIVLGFRPSAKRAELSAQERLRLQSQGNRIGVIVSVVTTVLTIILVAVIS